MKNIFYFLFINLILCITCLNANGQDAAYEKGQFQINGGIEFGVFDRDAYQYRNTTEYDNVSSNESTPISANIEYGISQSFSIGGYGSYFSKTWNYDNFSQEASESSFQAISFGVRGTLHGTPLINDLIKGLTINPDKWDIYTSLMVGIETLNWEHSWEDSFNDQPSSETKFRLGPVIGARYMFTPTIGAFAEFGGGANGAGRVGFSLNF